MATLIDPKRNKVRVVASGSVRVLGRMLHRTVYRVRGRELRIDSTHMQRVYSTTVMLSNPSYGDPAWSR